VTINLQNWVLAASL